MSYTYLSVSILNYLVSKIMNKIYHYAKNLFSYFQDCTYNYSLHYKNAKALRNHFEALRLKIDTENDITELKLYIMNMIIFAKKKYEQLGIKNLDDKHSIEEYNSMLETLRNIQQDNKELEKIVRSIETIFQSNKLNEDIVLEAIIILKLRYKKRQRSITQTNLIMNKFYKIINIYCKAISSDLICYTEKTQNMSVLATKALDINQTPPPRSK